MNKKQKILQITTIAFAILTLLLSTFRFFIYKLGGYWVALSLLFRLIFFVGIFVVTVLLTVRIVKNKIWRHKINYFTLVISLVLLCSYQLHYKISNGNTFQSPLKIIASYDNSWLFFRENGKFEISSVGYWGYIHYSTGKYMQNNDSLFLNFTRLDFKQDEKYHLGDTLVVKDSILYKVQNDTLVSTHYNLTDGRRPKK